MRIWTIGHSTRSLAELIAVLSAHGIKQVVDVRHFPVSSANPQFNKEVLEKKLPVAGIKYIWLEELGGFRRGGYAAYTKTKKYREVLGQLLKLARTAPTALMCAEFKWWTCHRRYIADSLVQARHTVIHIFDAQKVQEHKLLERMRKIKCDRKKFD